MGYDHWKTTNPDDEKLGPEPDEDDRYQRLLYKYTHVGCPAAHYEDVCEHPGDCAEYGRCLEIALIAHQDKIETDQG